MSDAPTVLIADDDRDILDIVTFRLERSGFKVIRASDGREAHELAVKHRPDVVVTDVMMPHMDGYELAKALRSDPATSHIPVIVLTALSQEEDAARAFESGAVDFVRKPFSPLELKARVQAALQRR
jgi:DNA-binding response OmpR family regulator